MEESRKYRQILEAAIDLFSQRGFESTSVQDIAQTAGIAKGTIYLYFKSKEDLIKQVYEYCYEMDIQACEEGVEAEKNAADKLCRRMDNIIDYLLGHPREARIEQMYKVFSSGQESFSCYQEEMYQAIEKVITDGSRKGELRDLPVSLLSRIYYGIAQGLYHGFQQEPNLWKSQDIKRQCHQLILDSFAPEQK